MDAIPASGTSTSTASRHLARPYWPSAVTWPTSWSVRQAPASALKPPHTQSLVMARALLAETQVTETPGCPVVMDAAGILGYTEHSSEL